MGLLLVAGCHCPFYTSAGQRLKEHNPSPAKTLRTHMDQFSAQTSLLSSLWILLECLV